MRRRFLWRLGGLLGLLFGFACGGFALVTWLVMNLSGEPGVPHRAAFLAGPLGILALGLVFIGLLWAGRAFRHLAAPIGDMIAAAGQVAEGDYSARVEEHGPHEVRSLAHAFNAMTERLQAHDQQRRNLLAEVTHELRTPLTVIQGNLEGLLDGVYPRDEAHLNAILDETRLMSRLIDDLRTLALAEGGALQLQKEPTDVGVLVREVAASFQTQADTTGVGLLVDIAADLPLLEVDPVRVREVLANLIANALHYTPRAGQVAIGCTPQDTATPGVTVSVSDTGSGIPPDDLPHIFDRFYKSRDSRGSGLGLAIARNLIVMHDGTITASSEIGQGTTIRFTLPTTPGG